MCHGPKLRPKDRCHLSYWSIWSEYLLQVITCTVLVVDGRGIFLAVLYSTSASHVSSRMFLKTLTDDDSVKYCGNLFHSVWKQESPADAVKPARRKSMPKLLQFDVFRFISPNSISPNCQCIASRDRPMFSQALGLYSCTQFEIRCLPIIKFLVQIAST